MLFGKPPAIDRARFDAALAILATDVDDARRQVPGLLELGFTEGQAWRFAVFAPVGLAQALLETLGVKAFADHASVRMVEGVTAKAKLRKQPEYVQALMLGRAHMKTGCLNREHYKAVVEVTAEVAAADKALNAGVGIKGGSIAVVLLTAEVVPHIRR